MKNVQDMSYEEFIKHIANTSFHSGMDGMLDTLIEMIDNLMELGLDQIPGDVVAQTIRTSCEIAKLEAMAHD